PLLSNDACFIVKDGTGQLPHLIALPPLPFSWADRGLTCAAVCDADHSAPNALLLSCGRTVVTGGAPPTANLRPLKGGPLSLRGVRVPSLAWRSARDFFTGACLDRALPLALAIAT